MGKEKFLNSGIHIVELRNLKGDVNVKLSYQQNRYPSKNETAIRKRS